MRFSLLAALLAIAGCGAAERAGGRIDPALAALVPHDTLMLTGVRLAELRTTPFYARAVAQQRVSELDSLAKGANFDPRRDVDQFLLASDGADSVVLARGRFQPKIPDNVKKSLYKGATLYSFEYNTAYSILDPSTAVVGPERGVRKVIDQKQNHRPGAEALLDRARALPGAGQFWLVSNGWGSLGDRASALDGNLSNLGRFLKSLVSASVTADFRDGVNAQVHGECRNEPDAKSLGDALRGLVALGRLSAPKDQPELSRLFDGFRVDQQQNSIQVSVYIPPDLVERLLRLYGKS